MVWRQVEGLRLRFAGKSIPTEKFAAKKAQRYSSSTPVKLVVPVLVRTRSLSELMCFFIFAFVSNNHLLPQEMMYVWNGFTIVGKRPELTEGILSTLEKAEEQLRNDPSKENFLISGFFFNTDTRLTVYCVMCRPIRVPHGRWVRCPAAEGSVLKKSGTAGPGWDLLQLCNLQVSLSWCHCNTPEAFEWESTKSPQQKLLLQQSLQ